MVTFLAGGTGTPKLLSGADTVFSPADTTVIGNTGDDVELGGLLVCPDIDTVLFSQGGVLDTDRWWGIKNDTEETNRALHDLAEDAGLPQGPRYLSDHKQTASRRLARWRRFSGVGEFMTIGDRDRAVHITRTSLLDEGHSLTEVTQTLADAFDVDLTVLPMSDDPVASIIHTTNGEMHFQEFWVGKHAGPEIERVEFRGAEAARATPAVLAALSDPVVIGPSNPITSIGPMLAIPEIRDALSATTVVAVSPFIEDTVFSGPAGDLMAASGFDPSTAGVAEAYPFADAFVLDIEDSTTLDRPTVKTDTHMDTQADAARVAEAVAAALEVA